MSDVYGYFIDSIIGSYTVPEIRQMVSANTNIAYVMNSKHESYSTILFKACRLLNFKLDISKVIEYMGRKHPNLHQLFTSDSKAMSWLENNINNLNQIIG